MKFLAYPLPFVSGYMDSKEKYRQLCATETDIPIFSQDWWLDTVCGEEKWDIVCVEEKGRIMATMPLYMPLKGLYIMPACTQTLGPWFSALSSDTKTASAVGKRQEWCKLLIEQISPFRYFQQNLTYAITDWLPFYWKDYRQTTRYTYLLKEIQNTEKLQEGMSANIRRNIAKAQERFGIRVKKGISIADFLSVRQQTFDRQGLATSAYETEKLRRLIAVCRERNQGDLWGGYDEEGHLHAAAFIVWQQSSAYYLAGGGNPALRGSGAHSLVLWEGIRYVSQFTSTFDFEGSMIPGVERFFREFGAKQTPFFTITKGKFSLLDKAYLKTSRMINRK